MKLEINYIGAPVSTTYKRKLNCVLMLVFKNTFILKNLKFSKLLASADEQVRILWFIGASI